MCTGTIIISFIRAVVPMQKQNVHAQFSHISGAINAILYASLTPQVNYVVINLV